MVFILDQNNFIMSTKINTYLNFPGNCEAAFSFYKSVFGGDFEYVGRYAEMPPQEGVTLTDDMKDKLMHISLRIDPDTLLMGCDTGGDWAPELITGNNFSIMVNANSKEEADKLFDSLSAEGNITMPIADMFWGDYFGSCTDKFGVNWMVNFNTGQPNS